MKCDEQMRGAVIQFILYAGLKTSSANAKQMDVTSQKGKPMIIIIIKILIIIIIIIILIIICYNKPTVVCVITLHIL